MVLLVQYSIHRGIDMSRMGAYYHKLCEDAEIMTIGEFVKENGQQYLDIYARVQNIRLEEYDDEEI